MKTKEPPVISNAVIFFVKIELPERGPLECAVGLDYGGSTQTAFVPIARLEDLLRVVEVEEFSQIKGRAVRVMSSSTCVFNLSHIIDNEATLHLKAIQ